MPDRRTLPDASQHPDPDGIMTILRKYLGVIEMPT